MSIADDCTFSGPAVDEATGTLASSPNIHKEQGHSMNIVFSHSLLMSITIALLLLPWLTEATYGEDPQLREAVECNPRGGLPNFMAKVKKGESLKIAYLGGSITEQTGWRVRSLNFLKERYPKATFTEIDAAMAGTGSYMGVFRLGHDVLRFEPDLLFVEFAVNDARVKPEAIIRQMEGIVRKTWKQCPTCDICFVYTLNFRLLPELQAGKCPPAASAMEQVADFYAIPSIHMGIEVARLEKEGKLQMKVPGVQMPSMAGKEIDLDFSIPVSADGTIAFSPDGTHPYLETGHLLYLKAIMRSWPKLEAASAEPLPHALADSLTADNLEHTVMLPIDSATRTGPWKKLSDEEIDRLRKRVKMRMPSVWKGQPGAELTFHAKGSSIALYDIHGPDSGKLKITVDGKATTVNRFGRYDIIHRYDTLEVASDLDPTKEHVITIKVLADPIDKLAVLPDASHKRYHDDPESFAGTNWYVGGIFIVR